MAKSTKTAAAPGKGRRTILSRTNETHVDGAGAAWSPPALQPAVPGKPVAMRLVVPQARASGRESTPSNEPISPDESFEQIAARRPADFARVIEAMMPSGPDAAEGMDKVTTLVIGLGHRIASKVLEHCDSHLVERIAKSVQRTESIMAKDAQEVFAEARENLLSGNYSVPGGWVTARTLLYGALGSSARFAIDRMLEDDLDKVGIEALQEMDTASMVSYFVHEHPQTIALALARMDPEWSAGVLNQFSPELKTEVLDRIAELDTIPARALFELQSSIKYEVSALLTGSMRKIGGPEVASQIRNHLAPTSEAPSSEEQSQ